MDGMSAVFICRMSRTALGYLRHGCCTIQLLGPQASLGMRCALAAAVSLQARRELLLCTVTSCSSRRARDGKVGNYRTPPLLRGG
jgi:hypothetical protein